MNILVLGGGGREHAIAWALAKSPRTDNLYAAPGNGGTDSVAQNVAGLNAEDGQAVLEFVKGNAIDLVVIGPEAPLVAGVADVLREAGVAVFGPDAQGAQLEGSKTYSKEFMQANGIPTARYGSFTELEPALAYVHELGAPVVVKADGLAAGKGVVVADTIEVAEDAVRSCFDGAFGQAGSTVVIEECLTGPECSLLAFVSGGKAHCMATAQDHKRAFDGDRGPNTGGMGAYSPLPFITEEDEREAVERIMRPVAEAMVAEGSPFEGVLYGGLMKTAGGIKVIEFNARFGDPETEVVLPRLKSDIVDIFCAVADGRDARIEWDDVPALGIVLASKGYPGSYEKGYEIRGLDRVEGTVYHMGTKADGDRIVTAGGRVLFVVGRGATLAEARAAALRDVERIECDNLFHRTDIGHWALENE